MVFGTITVVPERETIRNGYVIRQTKVTRTDVRSRLAMESSLLRIPLGVSNSDGDSFSLPQLAIEQ